MANLSDVDMAADFVTVSTTPNPPPNLPYPTPVIKHWENWGNRYGDIVYQSGRLPSNCVVTDVVLQLMWQDGSILKTTRFGETPAARRPPRRLDLLASARRNGHRGAGAVVARGRRRRAVPPGLLGDRRPGRLSRFRSQLGRPQQPLTAFVGHRGLLVLLRRAQLDVRSVSPVVLATPFNARFDLSVLRNQPANRAIRLDSSPCVQRQWPKGRHSAAFGPLCSASERTRSG